MFLHKRQHLHRRHEVQSDSCMAANHGFNNRKGEAHTTAHSLSRKSEGGVKANDLLKTYDIYSWRLRMGRLSGLTATSALPSSSCIVFVPIPAQWYTCIHSCSFSLPHSLRSLLRTPHSSSQVLAISPFKILKHCSLCLPPCRNQIVCGIVRREKGRKERHGKREKGESECKWERERERQSGPLFFADRWKQ